MFTFNEEERYKNLFLLTTKITEDSLLEYVENYLGISVDTLIEELKEKNKTTDNLKIG